MARLDTICSMNMGQSPESSSYNDKGDGLPFFQGNADFGTVHPKVRVWCNTPTKIAHAGDIKMPYLRVANVFFNRLELNDVQKIGLQESEVEKTLLLKNDLLFVEGNGSPEQIGRVALWDGSIEPMSHQNHIIKARFISDSMIPGFAMYYFMLPIGRAQILESAVSTSGLYTLSVGKISNFTLPMPPRSEQESFMAIAAQVDKSKVAVQKALDEAQTLFDSLMQLEYVRLKAISKRKAP